jgi:hypothetical protein
MDSKKKKKIPLEDERDERQTNGVRLADVRLIDL